MNLSTYNQANQFYKNIILFSRIFCLLFFKGYDFLHNMENGMKLLVSFIARQTVIQAAVVQEAAPDLIVFINSSGSRKQLA